MDQAPEPQTGGPAEASAPPPAEAQPGVGIPPLEAPAGLLPEALPPPVAPPRPRRHTGDLLGSVQSLAITVVIAVFVITFVVQAFQIPSESMENTLLVGDYLLVDKIHFAHGGIWGEILPYSRIRRGDIIVFRYPVHPEQHFVKRVIAVPGDRVRLINKQVYINGVPQRENYVVYRSEAPDEYRDDFPATEFLNANVEAKWWVQMRHLVHGGELTVPPDHYFVLGDNRDESLDSRYWGFVPRENIIGRPLLIYFSLRHSQRVGPIALDASDKLFYFAYTLTHLVEEARWHRTFRLIR